MSKAKVAKQKSSKTATKPAARSQREKPLDLARAALEGTTVAVMTIDRDLIVTYANQATVALMRRYEADFRASFPAFRVEALIGSCIDMFHKKPEHQRRMLANPSLMPHTTDIHVGALTFQIHVTAMMDSAGKHVGNTLEWKDMTEVRAREVEVARLQSAIGNATTAIMMIDRDLVVTYVNESTRKLLARREAEIRKALPRFSAAAIVGTCIDDFHKRPEHQRRVLGDPSNLPHRGCARGEVGWQVVNGHAALREEFLHALRTNAVERAHVVVRERRPAALAERALVGSRAVGAGGNLRNRAGEHVAQRCDLRRSVEQ